MRLDARKGDSGWTCYDAKRCCEVRNVLWVDSATAEWAQINTSPGAVLQHMFGGDLPHIVRKEERITIHADRRMVIFNEIDLGDDEQLQADEIIGRPAEVTPA